MLTQTKDDSLLPESDIEKAANVRVSTDNNPMPSPSPGLSITDPSPSTWKRWNHRIESLAGFEARGLERVPDSERLAPSNANFLQMYLLWLSSNMTIICTAASLTGPLIFGLGFTDSCWLAVFGTLLGACSTAYMSTWGAVSGNRMMVSIVYGQRVVLPELDTDCRPGRCSLRHGTFMDASSRLSMTNTSETLD